MVTNKIWITGRQLRKRWQIGHEDLIAYLGQPYGKEGEDTNLYLSAFEGPNGKTVLSPLYDTTSLEKQQKSPQSSGNVFLYELKLRKQEMLKAYNSSMDVNWADSLVFHVDEVMESEKGFDIVVPKEYDNITIMPSENPILDHESWAKELRNRKFFTGIELMRRWQVGEADLRVYLRMHYWDSEADCKVRLIPFDKTTLKPLREPEIESYELRYFVFPVRRVLEFEKEHGIVVAIKKKAGSLQNRRWMTGIEIMQRWNITERDLEDYIYTNFNELHPHVSGKPLDRGLADSRMGRDPFSDLEFWVKDVLAFEEQQGLRLFEDVMSISENESKPGNEKELVNLNGQQEKTLGASIPSAEEPLRAKERQELGRLRTEKQKWETSIIAAVHAALFCHGKKIKRDELKDELYQFDLPDTTVEHIWKALREKGLTKGPGRPSESSN